MGNSPKPSAENVESISLKVMSGPNKRAVSSLTPRVFDQVPLSLEGRFIETERGRLQIKAYKNTWNAQSLTQNAPNTIFFLSLLLASQKARHMRSWTLGMSAEQD